MRMRACPFIVAAIGLLLSCRVEAQLIGSTFTYQGVLKQGAVAVNGVVDFQFSLWNSAVGGLQVAPPLTVNSVTITQGGFVTSLDFGATVFDGNARWIQIAVRSPAGSGSFTTLTPRQPMTAVPYALHTRGLFVENNGDVGIGTIFPDSRLHIVGGDILAGANDQEWIFHTRSSNNGDFLHITDVDAGIPQFQRGLVLSQNGNSQLLGVAPYSFKMTNNANTPFEIGIAGAAGHYSNSATANDVVIRNTAAGANMHFQTGIGDAAITITPQNTVQIGTTNQSGLLNVGGGVGGISGAGDNYGVSGYTSGSVAGGAGVKGQGGGTSPGVEGSSISVNAIGVRGETPLTTGVSFAVVGKSGSPAGFDFYADGVGTNYGSSSSIRWKHNIEPIADPLAMLAQLRGVYYDWDIDHGGQHDIGMIAEEVGAVLPEIVNYEENGIDAIGMDYSKLTPLLVEAIKALKRDQEQALANVSADKDAQIAELRMANDELRRELAALRQAVRNIEPRP